MGGGATTEADLSGINLAAKLLDGTTLTVPVGGRIKNENGIISGRGGENAAALNPSTYLAGSPAAAAPAPAAPTTPAPANAQPPQAAAPSSSGNNGGVINLNTATKAELEGLPGIGPALADQIMAYRSSRPFQSVDELDNVPGIGVKRLDAVRALVTAP
jgi:competence protein ComEA